MLVPLLLHIKLSVAHKGRLHCAHALSYLLRAISHGHWQVSGHEAGVLALVTAEDTCVDLFYLLVVLVEWVVGAGCLEDASCNGCGGDVRLVKVGFFAGGGQVLRHCDALGVRRDELRVDPSRVR